ncbi:MAG: leucine-rich repeat domain-containing protein [Eubacteriales bacterium]|nr:leucine-rich repeat domain-containing protein [Eubacteriales bacterium]
METAQVMELGTEYDGTLNEAGGDNDYYAFPVKSGKFYKVEVFNLVYGKNNSTLVWLYARPGDGSWEQLSNNASSSDHKGDQTALLRADYTGDYYLLVNNDNGGSYSLRVTEYDPTGKVVKDSYKHQYKMTGTKYVEFKKPASLSSSQVIISSKFKIGEVGGLRILTPGNDVYVTTTAIGKNALKGSKVDYVGIPDTIKTIGAGAFYKCAKLTDVDMRTKSMSIGSKAFYACPKLKRVTFRGTTTIGTQAFYKCPRLTEITLHSKKTKVGTKAFYGCKRLANIWIYKDASIKSIAKDSFKGTKSGITVWYRSVSKAKKYFKKAGYKKAKYKKFSM